MQTDRWLNLTAPPAWLAVLGPADRVWWRALLVLVIGGAAAFALGLAVTAAGQALAGVVGGQPGAEAMASYQACLDRGGADCTIEIASRRHLGVQGEIFSALHGGLVVAALAAGLLLVARPLLKRPIRSFVTTAARFRWGHLAFGLAAMALVCGLLLAAERLLLPGGGDLSSGPLFWSSPAWMKLAYLAAAAAGILLAAGSEEVICRGWLLQQTGAVTASLPVILGLQAALFSLAHLPPDLGVFAIRMITGLVYGWAVLRLGGVEFAVGAHMANNLILAWVVGGMAEMKDSDFSLTLFALELAQSLAIVILAEALARRRRSSATAAPAPSAPAGRPAGPP
ncbi:MAG: CPBP family intramembrane metalloprotease [Caulobacter sp.]|nr:CPBP family intramembrane metalloprotease [Caulobacter sp.]